MTISQWFHLNQFEKGSRIFFSCPWSESPRSLVQGVRIGPKFLNFCRSWSGTRVEFFSHGPIQSVKLKTDHWSFKDRPFYPGTVPFSARWWHEYFVPDRVGPGPVRFWNSQSRSVLIWSSWFRLVIDWPISVRASLLPTGNELRYFFRESFASWVNRK